MGFSSWIPCYWSSALWNEGVRLALEPHVRGTLVTHSQGSKRFVIAPSGHGRLGAAAELGLMPATTMNRTCLRVGGCTCEPFGRAEFV